MSYDLRLVQFAVTTLLPEDSVEYMLCTSHDNLTLEDCFKVLEIAIHLQFTEHFVLLCIFLDFWQSFYYLA